MRAKSAKISDAERQQHECPKCGARPTFVCTDYKGQPAPLCVERGRPEITAKKLQKKADEKNAKALAELGGDNTLLTDYYGGADALMEAEGVKKLTAQDVAAAKLRDIRRGIENCGDAEHALVTGLNWITIWHMRRVAAALIGADWEARLWARCDSTFGPNINYIVNRYGNCLCTTDRVELDWVRHETKGEPTQWNPSGIKYRLEATAVWPPEGYAPVMARADFSAMFKLHHLSVRPVDEAGDDPTGLFDRTIGELVRRAA